MRRILTCGCTVAILLAGAQAAAHHGPGLYDRTKSVSVTGRVTQFRFMNPHVLIYVAAAGEDGREIVWSGELTSPNRLARSATPVDWHKDLLKPGDVVTLSGNPAQNGAPALLLNRVLDGEGNVLTATGR